MLRHKGKGRTYSHNLKLASILSGVAGIVNITSILEFKTLTTNITGHFAFFSEEIVLKNYKMAIVYLFYILFFLLGAFISNLIIEWVSNYKKQALYVIPISIEIFILFTVSFTTVLPTIDSFGFSMLIASSLLFSMGLQNALVTTVSQSVVRTTHLTGLFTDLGIELSRLFFYKRNFERVQLLKSIYLKLAIICCFFIGGLLGGFVFSYFELKTLLIPVGLLIFTLWYDQLLFRFYKLKRKITNHH
ncbi:YoaK family protein [Myroides odoratus]|nr:YoaK family protein [Flavobacterium sp.]